MGECQSSYNHADVSTKTGQYLGVNNSIFIILSYVVIYENVLNVLVKGINP